MSRRLRQTQLSFLPCKRKKEEASSTEKVQEVVEALPGAITGGKVVEAGGCMGPQVYAVELPIQFLLAVFSQLALRDVNRAAQVCRRWRSVGENNSFWKQALHRRYPRFPFDRMGKLRPMGIIRSLFNGVCSPWHEALPYATALRTHYGTYAWRLRVTSLNSEQDRLKVLMGVNKPQVLVGVEVASARVRPASQEENHHNVPRSRSWGAVSLPPSQHRGASPSLASHANPPWTSTPTVCQPAPETHSFFSPANQKRRALSSSCAFSLSPGSCQDMIMVADCTRGALGLYMAESEGEDPLAPIPLYKFSAQGWKTIPTPLLKPLPDSSQRLRPMVSARSCALQVEVQSMDGSTPLMLHITDSLQVENSYQAK